MRWRLYAVYSEQETPRRRPAWVGANFGAMRERFPQHLFCRAFSFFVPERGAVCFYLSCRERMPGQLWELLDSSAVLLLRFCYHASRCLFVCNCRPVLLVAKKVTLLANSVVCLLDHGEKITKWQWSEGKLCSRRCVHVPFTAVLRRLSVLGSQRS